MTDQDRDFVRRMQRGLPRLTEELSARKMRLLTLALIQSGQHALPRGHLEREEDVPAARCLEILASDDMTADRVWQWLALASDLERYYDPPFIPEQSLLTESVVGLASAIFETGDFSVMPILADALEEAGCDDESVLKHCRQSSTHIRGCWVIDALLGLE